MDRLKIYRRVLVGLLMASLVLFAGVLMQQIVSGIPDEIRLLAAEEQRVSLGVPATGEIYNEEAAEAADTPDSDIEADKLHLNLQRDTTIYADSTGSYSMDCKIFGLFKVKTVSVEVVDKTYVSPAGNAIGVYMETDGVLIIGTGPVTGMDGISYEPALNLVHSGDYITAIDGNDVSTKRELMDYLASCNGQEVVLTLERAGELVQIKVDPVQTGTNEYKLGIWVRDNTQGIGTLTYVDSDNRFGALGHGISDSDTGTLMNVSNGLLYEAQIMSIVKGENGTPGGLEGIIQYDDKYLLGEISKNTDAGIFGSIQNLSDLKINSTPVEICLKQEIELGDASILCAVDGEVREYDIQITDVNIAEDNVNKGIVLKVTDSTLLDLTGGIVQGMSGSPILQNGKIVGAVTHVFVQDSTKGYGIFIENMLESD